MKLITYGSYGGLRPYAVVKYARGHGCGYVSDPGLADYVMSFRDKPMDDLPDLAADPGGLRFLRTATRGGVTVHEFLGWTDPDGAPKGMAVKVCVNEYDEATVKVRIATYEGAEVLAPLPEYEPDPAIPGLYRLVDR